MNRFLVLMCLTVFSASQTLHLNGQAVDQQSPTNADLFDQVWQVVRDDFYDSQMNGVDWSAMRDRYRPPAIVSKNQADFARAVNAMLDELNASHTVYLTWENPRYYQLLGVFESSGAYEKQLDQVRRTLPESRLAYCCIGIDTMQTDQGQFVSAIYDGSPAQEAGVLVGDRLISADGQPFHPIRSFRGRSGKPVRLTLQRIESGPHIQFTVTPKLFSAADMFMDAAEQSARLITAADKQIAYVHLWSYSGQKYQELLVSLLFGDKLKHADALLLDLRDGWGGASTSYLNLFNRDVPLLTMKRRGAEPVLLDSQWRKPVALLINGSVRSGKEAFTYGFRESELGPIIGSRTAGAVLAGALRFLPDNSVLYLAVADIEVNGRRLEGVGVEPTLAVERSIPFCEGRDPQLEAGVHELTKILQQ